jgi:agmatinase
MRQCLKLKGVNLVQVGIRNISTDTDEFGFWKKNHKQIRTFWAKDMAKWKIKEIIESLGKNVYLTFDVDAFDSGIMPSTGTPEPGGLQWYQAMEILKAVASKRNIIGADVVELAPIQNLHAPDFLAAKLVYKIIGYKFLL